MSICSNVADQSTRSECGDGREAMEEWWLSTLIPKPSDNWIWHVKLTNKNTHKTVRFLQLPLFPSQCLDNTSWLSLLHLCFGDDHLMLRGHVIIYFKTSFVQLPPGFLWIATMIGQVLPVAATETNSQIEHSVIKVWSKTENQSHR